ncbi:hypothetical protein QRB35_13335, partial [Mycobacterium intracellulare subsp. chimaera]|nr:hypothetical protein [Mycobacterium intracellulare subsp. chimaera]
RLRIQQLPIRPRNPLHHNIITRHRAHSRQTQPTMDQLFSAFLAHGGPIAWPLMITLSWAVVLLAVFIPLAVRGYRLAAEASA